jgi:hypothetical protein
MTPEEFFTKYLTDRGINLDIARKYNVRALNGLEISSLTCRPDGLKMISGILIGDVVRPQRCPVWKKKDEDEDVWELGIFKVPASERFSGEWRFAARNHFHGWFEENADNYEGELFEYKGGLVKVRASKDDKREIDIFQEAFYPARLPEDEDRIDSMKFVPIGKTRGLYIPESVRGNRTLLIVEGATRVLAVLSHLEGLGLDVIGLPSCWPSKDNLEELIGHAKTAKSIFVVLDGDVVSNPKVMAALQRIVRALQGDDNDREIYIGIPQVKDEKGAVVEKAGLDDLLYRRPEGLRKFLSDCLPWDPQKAVDSLVSIAHQLGHPDLYGSTARVAGSELIGARWSLALYEKSRQRLVGAGYPTELHPEPAGKLLWQTDRNNDVPLVFPEYVRPYIHYAPVLDTKEQRSTVKVDEQNLCTPVADKAVAPAIRDILAELMGEPPKAAVVREGMAQWGYIQAQTIMPVRRAPETVLAYAELPAAVEGPITAWREFLDRCSCPDTVLSFLYTLTFEDHPGRQCLYLKGPDGNDGKSTIIRVLTDLLRGAVTGLTHSVTRFDGKGENRFLLAGLRPWCRLFFLDDVRIASVFENETFRSLAAGGYIPTEQKNKDNAISYAHPRMILTSNMQLRNFDGAENTRILQVNVTRGRDTVDATWKDRLKAEFPALLWHAQEAYERLALDGGTIRLTDATKAAAAEGQAAIEEKYAPVLQYLEISDGGRLTNEELGAVVKGAGFHEEYHVADVKRLLKVISGGKVIPAPEPAWINGRTRRYLTNVRRKGAILTPVVMQNSQGLRFS